MRRGPVVVCALALLLALPGQAQQTPAPQVPTPRIPQPPVPMPRIPRPRLPRLPIPGKTKTPDPRKSEADVIHFLGRLRKAGPEQILIETIEREEVEIRVTPQTRFFEGKERMTRIELGEGDELLIEAQRVKEGTPAARKIIVRKRASSGKAPQPGSVPEPARHQDSEEEHPVLRRGKPQSKPDESIESATRPCDRFWEAVRDHNLAFLDEIPNFVCSESVARFQSHSGKGNWRRRDSVTADVAFADGKEDYANVRVNGKAASAAQAEATGTWSFGEWATTLKMLLASVRTYQVTGKATLDGMPASIVRFEVPQPASAWQIRYHGRSVNPAYRGSLWIDTNSARVLRIALQSISTPADFEIEWAEWVVDYRYTRIGEDWHLLPSTAENAACWRWRADCTRNELTFRDYRQFTAESFLYTTDTTIEYGKPAKK